MLNEIHVIRHPQVNLPVGVCYGASDVEISKDGWLEMKNLRLDADYDSVFCSPSLRCRTLADYFNFTYTVDTRLMELNFGSWEMKKWEDIPENEIDPWYKDYYNVKAGGCESLSDMKVRVNEFLKDINKINRKKILIITHAGVIRLIRHLLLSTDQTEIFDFKVVHARIYIYLSDGESWKDTEFHLLKK